MTTTTSERQPADPDAMLTINQIAAKLGCSRDCAAKWLAKHDVPRVNIGTGEHLMLRVAPADFAAAVAACQVAKSPAEVSMPRRPKQRHYEPVYYGRSRPAKTSSKFASESAAGSH